MRFGEQFRLIARDAKYQKITTSLLISSTFNPLTRFLPGRPVGMTPGLFTAYHLCRKIDDIADADQPLPERYESFSDMVDELKNAMKQNKYPETDLGILLRGTVRDMNDYHRVDLKAQLNNFLDAMLYENERRLKRMISTKSELTRLYQNSFGVPQDIAFIGSGTSVRSNDLPELAELQGRVYAVRDLLPELSKGIIFIPKEAIPSDISIDTLCENPHSIPEINDWVRDEIIEGKRMVKALKTKKFDRRANIIIKFLTGGIETYLETYKKQNLF